jgi:flagellar biosynthesis protein FliP
MLTELKEPLPLRNEESYRSFALLEGTNLLQLLLCKEEKEKLPSSSHKAEPLMLKRQMGSCILIFSVLFFALFSSNAFAQANNANVQLNVSLGDLASSEHMSTNLQILLLFTVLTLAPSVIVMMTSFTRIVVVLSFLRTALGIQQPSSQILVALSLFLTGFIMYPVWTKINQDALTPLREKKIESSVAIERAIGPLKGFMLKQTRDKDLALFTSMMPPLKEGEVAPKGPEELPMQVVIPAFMISELRTAFQMGFVIFLPFLVIDMVVSSILMAMGMMMLPPVMVTLPLKILVFVLADGWGLLIRSLVLSFQ